MKYELEFILHIIPQDNMLEFGFHKHLTALLVLCYSLVQYSYSKKRERELQSSPNSTRTLEEATYL